jgi:hypothetical protein
MCDVQAKVFRPQSFVISEDTAIRRMPLTPPSNQSEQFRRDFDYRTFIYDCAWDRERSEAVFLAPQFNNLRAYAERTRFLASPGWQVSPHSITKFDRHDQVRVRVPPESRRVYVANALGMQVFDLDTSDLGFFEGRRVLLTTSKNNEIVWLRDWIAYHQALHGADAVLLFDNASDRYRIEELLTALSGIVGIARLGIVSWPFPWGGYPPDDREDAWEDHCQYGALETAHWRFLQRARSVVNCDVDELIMPLKSGLGLFEAAETAPAGIVHSIGSWSTLVSDDTLPASLGRVGIVTHGDFRVTMRRDPEASDVLKWAAVPAKQRGQWLVHRIAAPGYDDATAGLGAPPEPVATHRHLRQLSTNWRYDRSRIEVYDPAIHYVDDELKQALERLAPVSAVAATGL